MKTVFSEFLYLKSNQSVNFQVSCSNSIFLKRLILELILALPGKQESGDKSSPYVSRDGRIYNTEIIHEIDWIILEWWWFWNLFKLSYTFNFRFLLDIFKIINMLTFKNLAPTMFKKSFLERVSLLYLLEGKGYVINCVIYCSLV